MTQNTPAPDGVPPAPEGVPIAVVELETGLSKDVLRKWEARYRFPAPSRDAHGDRVYSREQVSQLRTIKRLMDGGYRPSKLLGMDEQALAELARTPASGTRGAEAATTAVAEWLKLLKMNQPEHFRSALDRQLQTQGLKHFVEDTMAPLSTAVGEAWSRGELRVFEEHQFADMASVILRHALEDIDTPQGRPRILLTTVPGELHALGLLMAACMFALDGAHCIYLGSEMPAAEIAHAAQAHSVDVVALSFSGAFAARRIPPVLRGLRLQLPARIKLVAGGIGVRRQKPPEGVLLLRDLRNINEFLAAHRAA